MTNEQLLQYAEGLLFTSKFLDYEKSHPKTAQAISLLKEAVKIADENDMVGVPAIVEWFQKYDSEIFYKEH